MDLLNKLKGQATGGNKVRYAYHVHGLPQVDHLIY